MQPAFRNLLCLALSLATASATASAVPEKVAGKLLSGSGGYTLYTYDPDGASGTSRCIAACADVWPPYVADDGATPSGDFSLTTRSDGKRQWVYRQRPLYLFAGDAAPGDHDGDGVNGSWHVIR